MVFDVRGAGGGGDIFAVRVSMDGAALVSRLDGSALAVDPGQHTFAFAADGFAGI